MAKEKAALKEKGIDVIDLSVGTPNIPPTQKIKQTIAYEVTKDESYLYAFASHGWQIDKPRATMFVWAKIPEKFGTDDVAYCG